RARRRARPGQGREGCAGGGAWAGPERRNGPGAYPGPSWGARRARLLLARNVAVGFAHALDDRGHGLHEHDHDLRLGLPLRGQLVLAHAARILVVVLDLGLLVLEVVQLVGQIHDPVEHLVGDLAEHDGQRHQVAAALGRGAGLALALDLHVVDEGEVVALDVAHGRAP